MAKNNLIAIHCFGTELGLLGIDENRGASSFQYSEAFLQTGRYRQLFPLIIKRTRLTQVFNKYNHETFRGLPPMIADSLPDLFGNIIFKTWMETHHKNETEFSVLEQLLYVGTRGMGALEYQPATSIAAGSHIDLEAITLLVKRVLDQKNTLHHKQMDHVSLLNIFRLGTSAGGVRPKILVSQHKASGNIVPGDITVDDAYEHYLVKLGMDDQVGYSRELIEYAYYLTASQAGISMMHCKMIDNKHFATLRFDRQGGKKRHVLTATGIAGLDYKNPKVSSYENLFELLLHLNCPHKDLEELFRRMVFNLVFANHDDHLKNHSFIYDEIQDLWNLAPAYDLTYSLNPEINFTTTTRALSINGKRKDIDFNDLKTIAEKYTIKNFNRIISEVQEATTYWRKHVNNLDIPQKTLTTIQKNFRFFSTS